MQLDPVTTWAAIVVVGIPWAVGVVAIVKRFARYLDRLDREEPLYDPVLENLRRGMQSVERQGGDRRG